jgi:transglutaminase-like putative cysteine protease
MMMRQYFLASACLFTLALAISRASLADTDPALTTEQAQAQIRRMMVPSPYKISERARGGPIRYSIATNGSANWDWPATGEQKITQQDDVWMITVCSDCGDEAVPDAETLQRYLAPNSAVDSDAKEIIAFARAATHRRSVAAQMRDLVNAVRKHMNGAIDFRRYDSASRALRSREGDCTEFAVLLAAAARARGIPTRVVSGIAYASRFTGQSHVFSPHMWVQAWDGTRWTSYDAGLGKFDAGHIAISIGDGTPESTQAAANLMPRLRIVDAVGVQYTEAPPNS